MRLSNTLDKCHTLTPFVTYGWGNLTDQSARNQRGEIGRSSLDLLTYSNIPKSLASMAGLTKQPKIGVFPGTTESYRKPMINFYAIGRTTLNTLTFVSTPNKVTARVPVGWTAKVTLGDVIPRLSAVIFTFTSGGYYVKTFAF
jgi:hypothetical protein